MPDEPQLEGAGPGPPAEADPLHLAADEDGGPLGGPVGRAVHAPTITRRPRASRRCRSPSLSSDPSRSGPAGRAGPPVEGGRVSTYERSAGAPGPTRATPAPRPAGAHPVGVRPPRSAGPGAGGHLAGLDGLRALAIAAVLVYHLDPGWLPGGFLGVDVFFVVSGFLITTLLVREAERARAGAAPRGCGSGGSTPGARDGCCPRSSSCSASAPSWPASSTPTCSSTSAARSSAP